VTWYTPPHRRLRRLEIEPNGDMVVTEYRGNKVAAFDPRTEKFIEYQLLFSYPYRANVDKNGDIWASTMSTDRVVRMNPKTGQTDQYLMPSDTNMRTVYVDNTTSPASFWIGGNYGHAIVHIEPLGCCKLTIQCACSLAGRRRVWPNGREHV